MEVNTQILWIGNDNIVELIGYRSATTGQFLNAATVTVTLKDAAGVDVSGESWPKSMAYVDGSNGTYRATLPAALPLVEYAQYTGIIDAVQGVGSTDQRRQTLMARYRNV